ncbi:MAG: hypothetical protein EB141_07580 [Verrucomicrobia bacterium]|nr:hypothetical protein [Pseudomonadota bacterium]NDB75489.1 hypothetical protein [Verrucomicrobiota bacterium]NDD38982.1 hypothetical protein [Verrucomicrobiota bacterium]NDE99049.1 hypothetical protein [Verrucomicrobiota bacterium]
MKIEIEIPDELIRETARQVVGDAFNAQSGYGKTTALTAIIKAVNDAIKCPAFEQQAAVAVRAEIERQMTPEVRARVMVGLRGAVNKAVKARTDELFTE